jgi:hypothetical protein
MPRSPAAGEGAIGTPPGQVADLTTRYRFVERYAIDTAKAKQKELVQYRVASRDVMKRMTEKPQGAPERQETTVQIIYTERPAQISASEVVTDTVRRYEAYRVDPPPDVKPSSATTLEGLTAWYRTKPGAPPMLLSLAPGRLLSETDYSVNSKLVFTPDLMGTLPALPSRVGDRWRLPKSAAAALFGARPQLGQPLVGTLLDVRKSSSGSDLVAVIGVSGRAVLSPNTGEALLNAEILFTFSPPPRSASDPGDGTIDARGAITDLRLARSTSAPVPQSGGRLKSTFTWQLVLERKINPPTPPLTIPTPTPVPTEANSWLTYDDPKGRFHFRHPQDLPQDASIPPDPNGVQLVDRSASGFPNEVFSLRLQEKTGKPQEDRDSRDPDTHLKGLKEEWKKTKQDFLLGPTGWLPEAEWAPRKLKVYRIEAALRADATGPKDSQRIFLDYYLILTGQDQSIVVEAMTANDPPLPYRKLAEDIIKTIRLEPSKPAG